VSVRPLSDVLVVRLEKARTTTAGGLIRPDTRQHPIRIGRVLQAGPGRRWKDRRTGQWSFWPTEAKPGDRVVFLAALLQTREGRQRSTSYSLDDDEALIRETDVLLVIDQDDPVEIDA
jgi:chaperonin GroES